MLLSLPDTKVVKNGKFMTIWDSGPKTLEIEFEDESISNIWEKYIEFWSKYNVDTPSIKEDEISSTKFLLKSKKVIKISDNVPEHFV